jgi:hypothetical protein
MSLLIDGSVFKHGTAEELACDELVRRLYFGKNFKLNKKELFEWGGGGVREILIFSTIKYPTFYEKTFQ